MVALVVLNYNDYQSTISLLARVKDYSIFELIVVVDGNSTDDSYDKLSLLSSNKIHLLKTDKNGGYGYGNNFGIKFAESKGANYVVVANPDVEFTEESIICCLNCIEFNHDCYCVAPLSSNGRAIKISNPILDVAFSNMLLNKIFRPRYYNKNYFKGKKWAYVDALPGSLVLYDIKKFFECGLFDENIFLYHEEITVAKKAKTIGYKSILLLDCSYIHNHSVSVNKSFKSALSLKKIVIKSHLYYLKNVCNSRAAWVLLQLIRPVCLIESIIWSKIKKR